MNKRIKKQKHEQLNANQIDDICVVDLTEPTKPTKTIKHATLLTGSSILNNVKTKELDSSTTVRSFPSAKLDTLKSKLS